MLHPSPCTQLNSFDIKSTTARMRFRIAVIRTITLKAVSDFCLSAFFFPLLIGNLLSKFSMGLLPIGDSRYTIVEAVFPFAVLPNMENYCSQNSYNNSQKPRLNASALSFCECLFRYYSIVPCHFILDCISITQECFCHLGIEVNGIDIQGFRHFVIV